MDCASVPKGPAKKRRRLSDAQDDPQNTALPTQPKRRFFDDDTAKEVPNELSLSLSFSPRSASSPAPEQRQPASGNPATSSPCRRAPPPSPSAAFDQTVFEAIVEQSIEPEVMQMIRDKCGNNMERAVNMFYDGTWKAALQRVHRAAAAPKAVPASAVPPSPSPRKMALAARPSVPEQRYVGAFGVEGWTTRSGINLLKHGDTVRIERQRAERPRLGGPKQKTKLGVAAAAHGNAAMSKRMDVIVRFTTTGGIELGRLSKQAASWVSALMDQKVCKFEGVCVYAPERLRTNDTVFLQLRCWLLRSAFDAKPARPDDNRTTGLFEEKETAEERGLRLRQVALVRLFEEINLLPTRVNEAAAKRGRRGLLEAAEMAEQRDSKDVPKEVPSTPTPTTSDEPEDGQELEQDQLDALYRKAQSFDFNTPEAEPPDTFALSLRPYQKQALHWMLSKERDGEGENAETRGEKASMHPLWEEYLWPLQDVDGNDLPPVQGQPSFYINPYSGDLSLEFPAQEQNCRGGILADEMGLGKTIQMLSLIHAHKSPVAMQQQDGKAAEGLGSLGRMLSRLPDVADAPCTTLVVAPMSLLAQWQSEAERASTDGSLRSMVYYGYDKAANLKALCSASAAGTAPDVVITSYGTVLSEFTQMWSRGWSRGSSNSSSDAHPGQGLFALNFFRIILDEGHTIKNRQSKTAKACYALTAEHRWVLTGTPVVNRLEDLFSLIRFLRVEPWDNFSFWRTFITVPFESKDFMRALDVVQTVLEPLVMRRTKDMKTPDGRPLVALPPKQLEIVDVELSATERDIYDHIFMRVKRSFTATVEAGTVMKAYTSIFAQVLRLRQCCCHPVLVRNMDIVADEIEAGAAADAAAGLADDMDLQALIERFTATTDEADDPASSNAFGAHVLGQIRDEAVNECPICAEEPMIDQTVTGCWHSACKDCLLRFIRHETDQHRLPRCFHCREVISRRDLFGVVRHDDDPATAGQPPRISLQRVDVGESSAKIVSLVRHLRDLRRERPAVKSVVFSQFTSFLSLIEPALRRDNMAFLRLDGTMAQKARAAVLEDFRRTDRFTVLLISLRAGGVGLNLTAAKRVFVMDPWWSFAVEAQAIDRVHRMGQDEEVKVYRFIVKGSVEEKMLKIQDRKKFIATSLGMMSDEEKKLQRIEDIKELLS